MGETGVLPFIRGLDLSNYDFSEPEAFPYIDGMAGLRWLKANESNLTAVPEVLGKLVKLEHLSLKENALTKVHGELTELKCLRTLNLRRNKIRSSGIPAELFNSEELTTIDLSFNELRSVPDGLDKAKNLLALNLSHNKITSMSTNVFVNTVDLLHLDLSDNELESLPPQLRRLVNLQVLNVSNNPLGHFQFRQLPSLISLTTLHMSNTQRTMSNLPGSLENLTRLTDVDLSMNDLPKIPDCLYTLAHLARLNLSDNCLKDLSVAIDLWTHMEVLILTRNELTSLPASICKLSRLRRLYVSDNKLTFQGLPSGIGKLTELEVFNAAYNALEMIPEGLCRCPRLRMLDLRFNKLVTLPDTIHRITELDLQLEGNPDLYVPPIPAGYLGPSLQFYNIDFDRQAKICSDGGVLAPQNSETALQSAAKDPIARKLRLRKSRGETPDKDQAKILKGMKEIAKAKNRSKNGAAGDFVAESVVPKRWEDRLEKPKLDVSEYFPEYVGQAPGLMVWEIDNFIPVELPEALHGNFYEGDCYIVLTTYLNENGALAWQIFFWIGEKSTKDKQTCSAVHAVYLRDTLGARCRTIREEQGDESAEFLALFDGHINYIEGGRTLSGFFSVEKPIHIPRMYRVHAYGQSIHLESVSPEVESLDPGFVFVLDRGEQIYVWMGSEARHTMKSKARLLAEKINKNERKNMSEIVMFEQGEEPSEFWLGLGVGTGAAPDDEFVRLIPEDWKPRKVCLYQVGLGLGYLELPRLDLFDLALQEVKKQADDHQSKPEGPLAVLNKHKNMTQSVLKSKQVYLLDCGNDIFVWFGKHSTRLVRVAAAKLAEELLNLLPTRSHHGSLIRVTEGTETLVFKSKFEGWDDVIAVDFTRTVESIRKTGADLMKWAKKQTAKVDLSALFQDRQRPEAPDESSDPFEEHNKDLVHMEAFVLQRKKFVRLPDTEIGHFYSGDSYVYVCRYRVPNCDPEPVTPVVESPGLAQAQAQVSSVVERSLTNGNIPRPPPMPPTSYNGSSGRPDYSGGGDTTETLSRMDAYDDDHEVDEEGDAPASHVNSRRRRRDDSYSGSEGLPEEDPETFTYYRVVYFWQGRDAAAMGWHIFFHDLLLQFNKDELEVVRLDQQRERAAFLSHFRGRFMIHKGSRTQALQRRKLDLDDRDCEGSAPVELFHMRSTGNPVYTRCIQVPTDARYLNSAFCYLLNVPFDARGDKGIVYAWIGDGASDGEANLIQEIAEEFCKGKEDYSLMVLEEGTEPENFFWVGIGGRKPYDNEADYMKHARLFRCSNDKGYFSVNEKCHDFCQDELADDDVMLLDNGQEVFIWLGPNASEVELKLAYKAALVYLQTVNAKNPQRKRKLKVTGRGYEPWSFTRCFHAWSAWKEKKLP